MFIHIDINECLTDPCSSTATCENTNGSYVCTCNTGYTGNGFNCTSMQTLHTYTHNILVCTFVCSLNKHGYSTNYYLSFADIVECELSPCNESAACFDTDGSFECACIDGYSGDGFNCTSQFQIIVQ